MTRDRWQRKATRRRGDGFGRYGAKFADLVPGGTQAGWVGVTIPLVAVPTAMLFGLDTPTFTGALIVVWGLLHLATAYFGYEGMERLSPVVVPILVLVGVVSTFIAVGDAGGAGGSFDAGSGGMGFAAAVTIVVGTFTSGGTQAPNWARFASSTRVGFWAGLILANFPLCWRLRVPKMDDVRFMRVRSTGVIAYVVGAAVAVLTAGHVVPGVAAPYVVPGVAGAALNGLVAAVIAHVAAYYLLESTGFPPATRSPPTPSGYDVNGPRRRRPRPVCSVVEFRVE